MNNDMVKEIKKDEEVIQEIKKEDKKQLVPFLLLMVVGFVGGYAMAFASDHVNLGNVPQLIGNFLKNISFFVPLTLAVIGTIVCVILNNKASKMYAVWDGEDEEGLAKVEGLISASMIFVSLSQIVSLIFMVVGITAMLEMEKSMGLLIRTGIFIGGIFVGIAYEVIAQMKAVNFIKRINPEKKGSVMDVKFQEKWMNSCDEAEKLTIYKSAYGAYKTISVMCMILWFVCLFGAIMWNFGLVPVFMVGTIWLAMQISYYYNAYKLEKRKNN